MKKTASICLLVPVLLLMLALGAPSAAQATPDPMTRQEIIDLAVSGVGYSYWWGNGCWGLDGLNQGSCSGSCPSCTHSGTLGADCSGYVAKVWQVPGPSAVTQCSHPYSTSNFRWESTHWSEIPRADAQPGDALVYRNADNTGGHIVLYESGDPWGDSWVYEARGCSYGIVHRLKSISSSYIAIRRHQLIEGTCDPVPPAGRVVDQTDPCFALGGPAEYWRTEQAGWDGSLKWTHAVDNQVYNYAVWNLDFDQAGRYRIEAYTAAPWAESEHANYQIHHDGVDSAVEVDQTAVDGWVIVGELEFAAGGDQWVRLEDLTGEPNSSETRVVFDALRLTPVQEEPIEEPDGGLPPDGGISPDGEAQVDGDLPGDDGAQPPDSAPDLDDPEDPRYGGWTGGCNCRSSDAAPGLPTLLLLLLALALLRTRRRR